MQTIRYILDGKASVIEIDRNEQHIKLDDLRSNIQTCHLTEKDTNDETKQETMEYRCERIRGVDVHVPGGLQIHTTQYISKLYNKAKKIDKLYGLFGK